MEAVFARREFLIAGNKIKKKKIKKSVSLKRYDRLARYAIWFLFSNYPVPRFFSLTTRQV